ncbi:MAG: SIMPL domain-containing protein [Acidobacteriota bacterium]
MTPITPIRAAALAAALAVALAPAPALAQRPAPPPEGPVIVTVGEGVVKLPPDRAWVTIAAESRARSPREAQRANADAMAAVLARIKAAGVPADAIRTSGYDLQPEFDFANGKQTLRGYVARNSVEVRVDDLPRVGEIIDAAVGSGATSVSGVRFDLKDRVAAERDALKRAVADARGRADAAAAGAGVTVDRVLRIEELRGPGPQDPRPVMMMRAAAAESAQTPITPGELEIRASVTMTSALR